MTAPPRVSVLNAPIDPERQLPALNRCLVVIIVSTVNALGECTGTSAFFRSRRKEGVTPRPAE